MDLELLVKIALTVMSVGTPVVLFFMAGFRSNMKEIKTDLKQNTESTVALATRMVGVDSKMKDLGERVSVLGERSHHMSNDMAVVKFALGVDKRGIPGDD